MKHIDAVLNRIPMYRLLLYGLLAIVVEAEFLATIHLVHFNPLWMMASLIIIGVAVFSTEWLLATLRDRPMNQESWLITSLILFLILSPASDVKTLLPLAVAGVIASASKLLLTWHGKHIFNPAAFSASVLSLTALWPASWWVGSSMLWWVALIVGALIVRKIRRGRIVLWFVAVALIVQIIQLINQGLLTFINLEHVMVASPLIFLSTIMLTEPATMPSRRKQQYYFVTIAALLYATGLSIGSFYIYPEAALLIVNLYAFIVSPKVATSFKLKSIDYVTPNIANFTFEPSRKITFMPGQYMEWTLPQVKIDSRGNRRMFTIASSSTERDVMLGVKFYQPSSAYKQKLQSLRPGSIMYVSQVNGDFVLPADKKRKLVFIAGGIGITPFRSMIKYLLDMKEERDVTLIYAVNDASEVAYRDVIDKAKRFGVKVYIVEGVPLTGEVLRKILRGQKDQLFYISGPNVMVDSVKQLLKQRGTYHRDIKTDYFFGY